MNALGEHTANPAGRPLHPKAARIAAHRVRISEDNFL